MIDDIPDSCYRAYHDHESDSRVDYESESYENYLDLLAEDAEWLLTLPKSTTDC